MADSRYKVIYRADEATRGEDALTWAPGCPLALAAVQVSRDVGSGDAFLQLRLKNVSTLEAPSFSLAAICEHVDGSIEQVDVNPLDGLAAKERSRKHKRNIVIAAFAVIVAIVAIVGFSTYSAGVAEEQKQARSQALHEDFSYYISNDMYGSLGELDASGTNFFNIAGEPDSKAYPVTFICKVELQNALKNGAWVKGTTFDIEFSEDGTASAEREIPDYSGASGNRAFQYFSVLKAEAYGNGWVYPTTAVRILVYEKGSGELVYTFEAEN